MDFKQIIHYWPLVFFGAVFLYLVFEYGRYRQQRRDRSDGKVVRLPDLPDTLILTRTLDQASIQRSKWLMGAMLLLIMSLPVLMVFIALDVQPDKSLSELFRLMMAKFSDKPGPVLNFIFMIILLGIVTIAVVAMNKNERLILDNQGITYVPPLRGLIKAMDIGWSLRWDEVAAVTLGRGFRRGRLTIKALQGTTRVLMPLVWHPVDESLRPEYKGLFSLMKFRYSLQHDVAAALQHLPVLRYIQEKTDLKIDTGKASALDFDLFKHPLTRNTIWIVFALMGYALVDSMANSEVYTQTPPLWWFLGFAALATLLVVAYLRDKAVPVSNVVGLGLVTGLIFAVAMYPGLLRINQLTASTAPQSYNYRYAGSYRFTPDSAGLPLITVKRSKYWDSIKSAEDYSFVLRQGGLGFYQLDMEPEYKKMRKWYCLQRADGDAKKAGECNKEK